MEYYLINECCEILDSQRIPVTANKRVKGIYPYYGANGIQDYVNDYIFDGEFVLVAEDGGNFGSKDKPIAYRASGKCWVNNHAHILKPYDFLDVDYLCFSLMFYNTEGLVNGATRQKLNQAQLRKMKVPKLPLEKQKQIVIEINRIISAKSILEKQLNNLNDLIKSRFIEMFGSIDLSPQLKEWKPLSELGTIYTGTTPSTTVEENWGGDILWITPAEMSDDSFFIYDTVRKITQKGQLSKSLNLMPVGTVLLSTRAPIGKVGIVASPMTCNQGFKNFYCPTVLNSIYLYVLLKNNTVYLNSIGTGTTFKEISKSNCGKIRIPVPEISAQNEFAEFVKLIDKSKFVCQVSLSIFCVKFLHFHHQP